MKFELNFQARMERQTQQVRRLQWVLVALTAVALLALSVASWRAFPHAAEPAAAEVDAGREGDELAVARMLEIAAESERLARLVSHQGEAIRRVLADIQASLPVSVRLRSLDYNAVEGRGTLVAESGDVMQLNAFVADLEQRPGIDRVVVSRQLADPAQGALHRYEVVMVARL